MQASANWRRSRIISKSHAKTLILILVAFSSGLFTSATMNGVSEVHAVGGFGYTLSISRGVTLTPGNSGSTTISATLVSGTASNVTLTCDLSNLPLPTFSGTTCAFSPTSIIPTLNGNATATLTVQVPTTAFYSANNVTVTAKSGSQAPVAPAVFTLTVAAKIAVTPTATASLSYSPTNPSPSFVVQLNLTDSPPFSGFIIGIFYNVSVLQVQGMDYSQGVLGSDANPIDQCINYSCSQGQPDPRYDANGVASLVLDTYSGQNATPPAGSNTINGELFRVTFAVVGKGFSAIHFVHQELQIPCTIKICYPLNVLHTIAYDGYFTNMECPSGSGSLCKPPNLSIAPPLRPIEFRPATFESTATSQNQGGFIREYNWTFGSGQSIIFLNSPIGKHSPSSNENVTFLNIGEWVVTLSVQDNYGARAYDTISLEVFRVWVDLGLLALSIDNTAGVLPGTPVHIQATAFNYGVNPENSTLRLSINNQNTATLPVVNLGPALGTTLIYEWHTVGVTPRVYRVDVTLDEVRNGTGPILENDTAIIQGRPVDPNNAQVGFVQFIYSVPSGFGLFLGLNLPETVGLGIVLLAVAGFVFGLIKKARAPPPEPL